MDNTARPLPGSQTKSEFRVRVCKACKHVINFTFCHYGCDYDDLDHRPEGTFFTAVYERVDTFLRDE